jgi:acyl carrier protein
MNNREIINGILQVQINERVEEVTEPTFEALGADSLDRVEMLMALEERLDIEIPDADAEKLLTVSDVCKYLESKAP